MIKVIVCKIGEPAVVAEVDNLWKYAKRELLDPGSYIQVVYLQDGVEILCDEEGGIEKYREGKLKKLPINRLVPAKAPEVGPNDFVIKMHPDLADPGEWGVHMVRGNFLMARYSDDKDKSLTDEDIKKYMWVLAGVSPCPRCGNPPCYNGAIYCGAACTARDGA